MDEKCVTASAFKTLSEFLSHYLSSKHKDMAITHTRIPNKDKTTKTYGGSYCIPDAELATFYRLYYDQVFVKKRKEHLTEVQFQDGPIVVDFDFRYPYETDTRQHSAEHIQDMILLYLEEMKMIFEFDEDSEFEIFIFEKPNVNRLAEKQLTKDGIHMMINLNTHRSVQQYLRSKILVELPKIWDLPITNTWETVLDEGISAGGTNWQMFGSCKPDHETYAITHHYVITYDPADKEFMMEENNPQSFNVKSHFRNLTARNAQNPKYKLTASVVLKMNELKESKKPRNKIRRADNYDEKAPLAGKNTAANWVNIQSKEELLEAMDDVLNHLNSSDYQLREIHECVQILPSQYYESGSHLLNRKVALALKHTDHRLFLSWVLLRSKASDFTYDSIADLYEEWTKYLIPKDDNPITSGSIRFWAKEANPEEYELIKTSSMDYYIEESIDSETEYDFARVLKQMHGQTYVCVSYEKRGGEWLHFNGTFWKKDKGLSLRQCISTYMYEIYAKKQDNILGRFNDQSIADDNNEKFGHRSKKLFTIKAKLKKTFDKNNIMREASELFYDGEFIRKMDASPHLMCFKNGVVDFNAKIFRPGLPSDYITKCTNIDYVPYNPTNPACAAVYAEINAFMNQLFPNKSVCDYMWNHLGASLIGTNKNQTFNVYHGSGCNGKSKLTDLMSHTIGEYKGTVPIALVTERRGLIGGTSDEVLKLKGCRYAVMQEPSKCVKLNEGPMKELTAGDPLQVRGMYCESEVFIPQFTLVVCTNNMFDITSNDDGTWRRIRKVVFESKFVDKLGDPVDEEVKHVFQKDKNLLEKFPHWAPYFAGMLVESAFKTNGIVPDCDVIMEASNKYRAEQDHITAFINEKIVITPNLGDKITKKDLMREFRTWYVDEQGSNERKMPKGNEINDMMTKRFGSYTPKGWSKVAFVDTMNKDEGEEEDSMKKV
jgi:P4 family phage/plasmid primase-like protien